MPVRRTQHDWLPRLGGGDRRDLAACLLVLVACTVAKFMWLDPVGPVIFFDELLYKQGAEALAGQGVYPSGHYPFLYPLLLAPGEMLHAGYFAIFVANAIATSTIIPACWLLGRAVGMRPGWPAALAAALLPLHWVFPTQVLSENLFVPLFTWAVWYAIRARVPGRISSVVYGAALASLFLVKYLALPAIPLIWATWLFGVATQSAGWRAAGRPAALSIAGMLAMVALWVAYAMGNGIAFAEAFGSKVSGLNAGDLMTPAAVLMWAAAYLCALVMLAAPFLPRILEGWSRFARAPLQALRESPRDRLLFLCSLLAGGYWLICIQHSAGAIHNYPVPQRIIVRYFMHLTPLIWVLGLALTLSPPPRARPWFGVAAAVLSGAALWVAHQVLYADIAWDLPAWFATIPLYSTDIIGFEPFAKLWALVGLVVAAGFVGRHRGLAWAWVAAWVVLQGSASLLAHDQAASMNSTRPLHAKALAPLVIQAAREHGRILVITELRQETPRILTQALEFWGADPTTFEVIGPGQERAARAETVEVLRITGSRRAGAVTHYRVGHATGYIYREHFDGTGGATELPSGDATFRVEPDWMCSGARPQVATLSWDARESGANRVRVFIFSSRDGSEKIFAGGPAVGRRPTGPWATPGMTFRLRTSDSGQLLAEAQIATRRCH
jgi:hypothetical protein